MQVRKPLPTLKSLAKENKKLQRLLRISLNQRVNKPDMVESVAANLIHITDSSYNNTSFGSDLRLNSSIAPDSASSAAKEKSKSSKRAKSGAESPHPKDFKKKAKNLRSQFFA